MGNRTDSAPSQATEIAQAVLRRPKFRPACETTQVIVLVGTQSDRQAAWLARAAARGAQL